MKKARRLLTALLLSSCLGASGSLSAQIGDAYSESRYSAVRPEWALGGLAVIAITAVLFQTSHHNH